MFFSDHGVFGDDIAMETTLHRQLKAIYADDERRLEQRVGDYRIDALCGNRLVEIQHGSLAAIRDKVRQLLTDHQVLVVKPLVVRKRLIKQDARGGRVLSRRLSPKRGSIFDLFDELVYFTNVFPHANLEIETPLVEIEEWRYPGHGRRRRRRFGDQQVEDQRLISIDRTYRFRATADLANLVAIDLPNPFHTGHLAAVLGVPRWTAQRIAYCLREMGGTDVVGKQRNAWLYQFTLPPTKKSRRRAA